MSSEAVIALRIYDSDVKNKLIKIYFVCGINVLDELAASKMGLVELLHVDYDRVHGLTTVFYRLSRKDIRVFLLELSASGIYHFILYDPSELEVQDFERDELIAELQKKSDRVRKLLQPSTEPSSDPSSSRSN
jgi:hypothetical protein